MWINMSLILKQINTYSTIHNLFWTNLRLPMVVMIHHSNLLFALQITWHIYITWTNVLRIVFGISWHLPPNRKAKITTTEQTVSVDSITSPVPTVCNQRCIQYEGVAPIVTVRWRCDAVLAKPVFIIGFCGVCQAQPTLPQHLSSLPLPTLVSQVT